MNNLDDPEERRVLIEAWITYPQAGSNIGTLVREADWATLPDEIKTRAINAWSTADADAFLDWTAELPTTVQERFLRVVSNALWRTALLLS